MASADFNNVILRNVAPANADGSFVHTDYVFTVGPDAKQRWTNDLKLNNVVVSSILVNSTLSLTAGNFITLYVSTGTFSTLSTTSITADSTITASTVNATNLTYSTLTGLVGTTSLLTASTANTTNLGFSTATGHLLTTNSLIVHSSLTTSSLQGINLTYLTLQGSTLSTGNAFASAIGFSTATGNVITANTVNATTANVNNGLFSTLTGSSLVASTLSVSTLYYSTLVGSTIQTSTLIASTLGFSTMTGSTLTAHILNVTTANVNSGVYSTLTGSSIETLTLFTSTLGFSTIQGSTLISAAVVVQSTLVGSTVNAVNIGFSTLIGNTLIINTVVSNSTLTGSTVNAMNIGVSTLVGSTLTFHTAVSNSTLTGSTVNAVNIGFSTLQGSSITTNTMLISTLAASSIQTTSLGYSTMNGSTIAASTINVVGLLNSANIGIGMTNPTYTLQASTLNTVNLSGNYIQDWTIVLANADATAFTPTFNGTQTGPSGSPPSMNVTVGGTGSANTVLTFTRNVIPGNVYELTLTAKMTGISPSFVLCDHIANDALIIGVPSQPLSNTYAPYVITFTARSGSFSISCRSQGGTIFSYYGVKLRGFFNQMIGGLGIGTTNPRYSLDVPKGSIQAYNYQQFEWINTQSNNRLGYDLVDPESTDGLFKVATMGVTNAPGTYGMLNVRGQIGGVSKTNTMYVDLVIMTRGGLTVWGTVYGRQSSAALQCDVVYSINANLEYDIYIYIKSSATPYIVYDLVVSGASGSNILYDPAATAMILMPNPPLTLVSISALASIYSDGGNVGLGKAADPAYRLDVNGIINATQFYQNGSPFISGGGGGGGGGGTGYTGPAGAGGPVAILSAVPSTTQTVSANTLSLVRWGIIDTAQSTGTTGLTYTSTLGPMNGTFVNNTSNTLPVLVQYSLVLNVTGTGYSYVGVTSATNVFTSYGITYNDTNGFANSYTVLLTPGASVGVYYTDNVVTDVQPTSRISLTILTAGAQGPTGPTGQVTKLSVKPSVATQPIPSNVLTLISWGSTIVSQTAGITGLAYTEEGLFTNNTSSTIPILVDYSMFVSYTGGGYTAIGINGSTTVYGARFNDNVAITNSFTILLAPGSALGIYYLDNAATTLLDSSHLSLTILTAGPQGPTGPSGQVATLSVTPTESIQTIPASVTLSLVIWGSTDTAQSIGSTGLAYNAGVFTNTMSTALLLLVEYTLNLNTTLSGFSAIGVNGSTTLFGSNYNDSNIATNSFTVLLPSGATLGIYYMDNTTVIVQQTSRLSLTVLTVGPQGPTGSSQWSLVGNALSYPGNISATGTVNSITVGRGPGGVASNTVIGANALANNTTGGNNFVAGFNAGYTTAGFTGSNNIYLGASAAPSSGGANNEIVIGQGATGAGSNTAVIGNPATVSTTLFGSVRSFNYTIVVSSTGYTTVIADDITGHPLYRNSGIWLVSANASTTVGNITLSATAYAATNINSSNATNVFGGFSASSYVSITGGTNTGAFLGYGVFLNVTNVAAYGTYNVNFLRIN